MTEEDGRSAKMLQLTQEFRKESDRAVALLSAAYLDELLRDLISTVMLLDSEKAKKDIFEGPAAPLSTFSSRIQIAYCLRLITKEQKQDLDHIRQIRNDFAHKLLGLSFETDKIMERCNRLEGAKVDGTPSSNRDKFIKASVRLMVEIIIKISKGKKLE